MKHQQFDGDIRDRLQKPPDSVEECLSGYGSSLLKFCFTKSTNVNERLINGFIPRYLLAAQFGRMELAIQAMFVATRSVSEVCCSVEFGLFWNRQVSDSRGANE